MFEDSLLESGGKFKTKRGATTTVAVVAQFALIGVLVLLPLIYTEALPKQQLMTFLVAPPPPPPPPPPPAAAPVHVVKKIETDLNNGALRTPTAIPKKVAMIKEDEAPPSTGVMGGVAGGVPGGSMGGVIGGIVSSAPVAVPKAVTPTKVRVSQGVSEGLLLHKVTPNYPPLAKQARIQGSVVLQATIGKDGSIQNLHVLSGHPMLTQSAIDAVKQWKYKPYLLNGDAVEVETTVQVNFTLSGG
jgi:protein TonB